MDQIKERNKRKRGKNLTNGERDLIADLATKYSSIIENKKTDSATVSLKENAWSELELEFNMMSAVKRTKNQIKQAYENLKKKAKKSAAADKVVRKRTGGCIFETSVDPISEKVLALLGNRATPLKNPFDSDAGYNEERINVVGASSSPSSVVMGIYEDSSANTLESNKGSGIEIGRITDECKLIPSEAITCTPDAEPLVCVTLNEPETSAASPRTPESDASTTPSSQLPTNADSKGHRDWMFRRKSISGTRRQNIASARAEASASLSECAIAKKTYYEQKLKIAIKEHQVRMQQEQREHDMRNLVLAAQRELYTKQLVYYSSNSPMSIPEKPNLTDINCNVKMNRHS